MMTQRNNSFELLSLFLITVCPDCLCYVLIILQYVFIYYIYDFSKLVWKRREGKFAVYIINSVLSTYFACACTGVLWLPRSFQKEECVHVRLQREGDSLAVQYQCYIQWPTGGPWIQGEHTLRLKILFSHPIGEYELHSTQWDHLY